MAYKNATITPNIPDDSLVCWWAHPPREPADPDLRILAKGLLLAPSIPNFVIKSLFVKKTQFWQGRKGVDRSCLYSCLYYIFTTSCLYSCLYYLLPLLPTNYLGTLICGGVWCFWGPHTWYRRITVKRRQKISRDIFFATFRVGRRSHWSIGFQNGISTYRFTQNWGKGSRKERRESRIIFCKYLITRGIDLNFKRTSEAILSLYYLLLLL